MSKFIKEYNFNKQIKVEIISTTRPEILESSDFTEWIGHKAVEVGTGLHKESFAVDEKYENDISCTFRVSSTDFTESLRSDKQNLYLRFSEVEEFANWISDSKFVKCADGTWIRNGVGDYRVVAENTQDLLALFRQQNSNLPF